MKNQKLKMLLRLLVCVAVSFACIWFVIFCGGWKLFEAGNVIFYEVAAAVVIGFVIWLIFEVSKRYESKIKELEKRISELEKKNS